MAYEFWLHSVWGKCDNNGLFGKEQWWEEGGIGAMAQEGL